jgi:pyrrolidone-carboxylate peptidase
LNVLELIVLTGFEPFDNHSRNLSEEIVKSFSNKIGNLPVVKKILPVSWKNCVKQYRKLVNRLKSLPQLVVLLGIHSDDLYHIEKYGWNLAFGIDNYNCFKCGPVLAAVKLRIPTLLDVNKIQADLRGFIKIGLSHYGGYFLCNYLYFFALKIADQRYPVIFIHIPSNEKINIGIIKIELIINSIIIKM